MEKLDVKKEPHYKGRKGVFQLLEVPDQSFLMIDGSGDPNTSKDYELSLEAVYPLAYALKFMSKNELERDYVVPPLEGLWWAEDMDVFTTRRDKNAWQWTMMIMTPEWIDRDMVEGARQTLTTKKDVPAFLDRVRWEQLSEGLAAQTLHVGSYDDEGPVLETMHKEFIPGNGLIMTGKHHEIYLGDPRRTAPERLRTLLRQPVIRT